MEQDNFYEANIINFRQHVKESDTVYGSCIPLLFISEEYEGTEIAIGKTEFEGETPLLTFEFDIIKNPKNLDINDEKLKRHIGDILISMIYEHLQNGTAVFKGGIDEVVKEGA